MINKLKKWNWGLFGFILLLCSVGALGNKSIDNIGHCFLAAAMFGVPFGLLWAWMTREE